MAALAAALVTIPPALLLVETAILQAFPQRKEITAVQAKMLRQIFMLAAAVVLERRAILTAKVTVATVQPRLSLARLLLTQAVVLLVAVAAQFQKPEQAAVALEHQTLLLAVTAQPIPAVAAVEAVTQLLAVMAAPAAPASSSSSTPYPYSLS